MKIVLKNITKKYKNKEVLSHLNFEFDNKIYAFIGHNGSGKSTLMRIITELIEPTQGEVIFYQNDKIIWIPIINRWRFKRNVEQKYSGYILSAYDW